jgi:hypothetical protein
MFSVGVGLQVRLSQQARHVQTAGINHSGV